MNETLPVQLNPTFSWFSNLFFFFFVERDYKLFVKNVPLFEYFVVIART